MNNYIRHTSLSLLGGLACMVSCTSERDMEPYFPQSEEEMKFEVVSRGTRTETTTSENIYDNPFMLFGDAKLSGDSEGNTLQTFFHWEKVRCTNKEKKTWEYDQKGQYWFMGQEHSFVAIHPFIEKGDPQVTILTFEDSKLSFTYTLPKELQEAKDLLFATHRRKYTLDETGPIQLEFTHLLPRINISMALIEKEFMYDHVKEDTTKNRNEYIKVHSIEFQNIKTKASFTFTAVPLGTKTSTYDYEKGYLVRNDDRTETIEVTLNKACKVPNSYIKPKEGEEENYEIKYVKALEDKEIVVMLPQEFKADSEAKMVVNYSINEDKDLSRRIVIPLAGKEWKEGHSYTYKFLIDNVYMDHVIDKGTITVDIEDFRLSGQTGDDSWITDEDDPGHNISYGYEEGEGGNCGPTN